MSIASPTVRRRAGFTIVELLIVIVVIGVLAAITVVAYNGIQARSRNAQTVSAMQAYYKGLVSYAALNGSYPAYTYACLSDAGGCWYGNTLDTGFTNALKTVMGNSLPVPPSGARWPIYLGTTYGMTVDGQPRAFLLYQVVPGISRCDFGPVATGSYPAFSSANLSSTNMSDPAKGECYVPLPAA